MFFTDKVQPIQEAYFGKAPKVVEMEKCIAEIRKKFWNTGIDGESFLNIGGRGLGTIEGSKPWQRLKTLFEEQFGFYSVSLMLWRMNLANACTIPVTWTFESMDCKDYLEVTNNGMRYKKSAEFCTFICISEGLLFNKDYTPGEIVAILLHEVGHNFDSAIYHYMGPFHIVNIFFMFIKSIISMEPVTILALLILIPKALRNEASKEYNELTTKKEYRVIWTLLDSFNYFLGLPHDILTRLLYPLGMIVTGTIGVVSSVLAAGPLGIILGLFDGYASENIADKFPAMHGYGPEMASAITKLETNNIGSEEIIDKLPIVGHIYGLFVVVAMAIFKITEPHPVLSARIRNQLNAIEGDLNKSNVDKKTKEKIKRDIKEINKRIDEYNKKDLGFTGQVKRAYFQMLISLFPKYGDIRSKLISFITDDEVIDDAIEYARDPVRRVKIK